MNRKEMWEKTKKDFNKKNENEFEDTEEIEERVPLTEEEKKNVKKEMTMLIWGILLIVIVFVVIKMLIPLFKKEEETRPIKEATPEETLEDGEIDVNNSIVQEINSMYDFDINNPLYEDNILKLFNTEKVNIKDLDFQTKMLLITSNKIFKNYMLENTNLTNYKTKEISITKSKLDELSKKIFGEDIGLEHSNFKYYYIDNSEVVYFDVLLNDEKYIFKQSTGKKSTIKVYTKLNYVYKVSNYITFTYSTLFVNNNGVYRDEKMNYIITKDIEIYNSYFGSADSYEFTYVIKDDKYYLNHLYIGQYTIK